MAFTLPLKGAAPALVGKERAGEIIINIILPFFAAFSQFTKQPELEENTLEVFQHYRAPAVNSLEKHMIQQLGTGLKTAATAQRRQGLLHIYKTCCIRGRCKECVLV